MSAVISRKTARTGLNFVGDHWGKIFIFGFLICTGTSKPGFSEEDILPLVFADAAFVFVLSLIYKKISEFLPEKSVKKPVKKPPVLDLKATMLQTTSGAQQNFRIRTEDELYRDLGEDFVDGMYQYAMELWLEGGVLYPEWYIGKLSENEVRDINKRISSCMRSKGHEFGENGEMVQQSRTISRLLAEGSRLGRR